MERRASRSGLREGNAAAPAEFLDQGGAIGTDPIDAVGEVPVEIVPRVAGPADDAHAFGAGPVDVVLASFDSVEIDIGAAGGDRARRR